MTNSQTVKIIRRPHFYDISGESASDLIRTLDGSRINLDPGQAVAISSTRFSRQTIEEAAKQLGINLVIETVPETWTLLDSFQLDAYDDLGQPANEWNIVQVWTRWDSERARFLTVHRHRSQCDNTQRLYVYATAACDTQIPITEHDLEIPKILKLTGLSPTSEVIAGNAKLGLIIYDLSDEERRFISE